MKTVTPEPFLQAERSHTDESLTTERGKTDESLFNLRKKTELETDAKVKIDRNEADQARAQSRTDTDSDSVLDHRVSEQRQFDDSAVHAERVSMDAALRHERKQKEAELSRFLDSEREDTDENLMRERQSSDTHHEQSLKRFKEEASLHSATKAALTTRDEFLAIVSHDLRNPIGAVLSCSEMLLEDEKYIGTNPDSKYWIEFIKRNAQTSLRLISDILDMERFAQGKLELRPAFHCMQELLSEVAEGFVHAAEAKEIQLTVTPSAIVKKVFCDRDRMAQVISNLLSNALKFTPELGSVTLRLEQLGDDVQVVVEDSGAGIAEEQKSHIFERFAQINNKDRRGLGLGLYIAKTLVEAHNGKIWVSSVPGQGSSFAFKMPMAAPKVNLHLLEESL
jgi:signal transduction histidine kinase